MLISLPIQPYNKTTTYILQERRETCRLTSMKLRYSPKHLNGMNIEETIFPRPFVICIRNIVRLVHIQNRNEHWLLLSSVKFWRIFSFGLCKMLSCIHRFLPVDICKFRHFFATNALFRNIISSNIRNLSQMVSHGERKRKRVF